MYLFFEMITIVLTNEKCYKIHFNILFKKEKNYIYNKNNEKYFFI